MKDCMPLIPLWNGLMLEGEGNEKETKDNNAPVEFWFHIVKNSILRKERSKNISNDQVLIQSDPTSCPQNQKGNN